jgi:hypothetical protein
MFPDADYGSLKSSLMGEAAGDWPIARLEKVPQPQSVGAP